MDFLGSAGLTPDLVVTPDSVDSRATRVFPLRLLVHLDTQDTVDIRDLAGSVVNLVIRGLADIQGSVGLAVEVGIRVLADSLDFLPLHLE